MNFAFVSSLPLGKRSIIKHETSFYGCPISKEHAVTAQTQHSNKIVMKMPSKAQTSRAKASFETRVAAAELAKDRGVTPSFSNGEELTLRRPVADDPDKNEPSLIGNFTKGQAHDEDGAIVNVADYQAWVEASNSGDEMEIAALPLGPLAGTDADGNFIWRSDLATKLGLTVRGWENQSAGLTFDLEGPDAQSVAMPPAPTIGSIEYTAELAELYLMALLRDVPFSGFTEAPYKELVDFAVKELNSLEWFNTPAKLTDTPEEIARRRGLVTPENLFRGILPGSEVGPYLSQYIVAGSLQLGDEALGAPTPEGPNAGDLEAGLIRYGSITINQAVRIATKEKDFMTSFPIFLDVQDGADFRTFETYEPGARLITTLRDLATWVHFDALYEAYLNACLVLLANGVPFDPNLPFQLPDAIDKQDVFVNFGSAHILSLVCEVATRALKAVRYQKFNVHRRNRPEGAGGLVHVNKISKGEKFPELTGVVSDLENILEKIGILNFKNNKNMDPPIHEKTFLLPQAFAEGSPFHPSYGSGHATVAGACVTILKAFFDAGYQLDSENIFEVDPKTSTLKRVKVDVPLTVEGELNKLADNISVGRDIAGVHWFSDQFESLLLGEEIAIGILEEQKLTFGENFFFTLPKFDGTTIFI